MSRTALRRPIPTDNYGPVTVPAGEYFMMGDNRDDSYDSRYWGFVPHDNIIGTPIMVYMSINAPGEAWDPGHIRDRMFTYRASSCIRALCAGAASSKCFNSNGSTPPGSSRHGRKSSSFMDYAEAGVNISLADQAKQRIRRLASRTFTRGVIGGIGSFGGLFALDKKWREPVLVSSADGVGTKLKIAVGHGNSLDGRRRPGESLRQRHSHARRRAAVFPRLSGDGQDGSEHRRATGRGDVARLPFRRVRADRRRNGRDAGLLRAGGIRSGGLHRRRARAREPEKNQRREAGRSAARAALHRTAHQRLFARAQAGLRSRGPAAGNLRRRSQQQNRRGAAAPAPLLLADAEDHGRARLAFRDGAHHGRRHHRKICRASCRAACRRKSSWARGPCRRFFPTSPGSANSSATNCCARSTWAWE